jgi:hypothetical protein
VTQRHSQVTDHEVEELRQWVSDLVIFPLPKEPASQGLRGKLGRFSNSLWQGTPPNVLQRYSPEIQDYVDKIVAQKKCQIITCEHSVNEIYIRPEFRQSVGTVVDVHSSVYGWTRNHLDMGRQPKSSARSSLFAVTVSV